MNLTSEQLSINLILWILKRKKTAIALKKKGYKFDPMDFETL